MTTDKEKKVNAFFVGFLEAQAVAFVLMILMMIYKA